MAFHTRKVKIRALNDSKEIAVIVYINSIILVLLAVTELALRQRHYLYTFLNGMALLTGGSLFLGLIFVPKVTMLIKINILICYYTILHIVKECMVQVDHFCLVDLIPSKTSLILSYCHDLWLQRNYDT